MKQLLLFFAIALPLGAWAEDATAPVETINFIFGEKMTLVKKSPEDKEAELNMRPRFEVKIPDDVSTIKDRKNPELYSKKTQCSLSKQTDKEKFEITEPVTIKGKLKTQSNVWHMLPPKSNGMLRQIIFAQSKDNFMVMSCFTKYQGSYVPTKDEHIFEILNDHMITPVEKVVTAQKTKVATPKDVVRAGK